MSIIPCHLLQGYFLLNFNKLRPRQNVHHFPKDLFKRILLNGNVWISIKISLKFIRKGPIDIIPALVQIMAWHRPGDKPLSEPMMVTLLTPHFCVTRRQWSPERNGSNSNSMIFKITLMQPYVITSQNESNTAHNSYLTHRRIQHCTGYAIQ